MSTARATRRVVRLGAVLYDTYVRLRDARENESLRMAYHGGVLEIMSPEFRPDRGSRQFLFLVAAYCKAFGVACTPAGGATVRRGEPGLQEGQGKEPDESFYLGDDARRVRDKDTLDLSEDPPPSLWIEVDNWGSSEARLPLYAGLGVPEIWRYRIRRRELWFGRLAGDRYEEVAASVALPGLTPAMVLDILAAPNAWDVAAWSAWLDTDWFPEHRQEMIDLARAIKPPPFDRAKR